MLGKTIENIEITLSIVTISQIKLLIHRKVAATRIQTNTFLRPPQHLYCSLYENTRVCYNSQQYEGTRLCSY